MLMQEKYMSRKLNSLRESPEHRDRLNLSSNYSPTEQKKNPSRLIKLQEIEPTPKYLDRRNSDSRKGMGAVKGRNSVVTKRTRYVVLKTEPD